MSYADWRERLRIAIDPRFYTIEYLDWLIKTERATFRAGERSAVVWEIRTYPSGVKALSFVVAAGDKRELVDDLRPQIEAWGRAQGCTFAIVESRDGWKRELAPHGYSSFQVSLAKEL